MSIQEIWQLSYAADASVAMVFAAVNTTVNRLGLWPYSLVTFPGTLSHELLHYLAAKLFLANPTLPDLWPRRNGNNWTMGSITFEPSFMNRIPIALAPMLLLPGSLLVVVELMHSATGWMYLFYAWVAGNMVHACWPSRQDWKVAAPALVIVVLLGICFWYFA